MTFEQTDKYLIPMLRSLRSDATFEGDLMVLVDCRVAEGKHLRDIALEIVALHEWHDRIGRL